MAYKVLYVECPDKPMSGQLLEERSAKEHFGTARRALARALGLLEDARAPYRLSPIQSEAAF